MANQIVAADKRQPANGRNTLNFLRLDISAKWRFGLMQFLRWPFPLNTPWHFPKFTYIFVVVTKRRNTPRTTQKQPEQAKNKPRTGGKTQEQAITVALVK